MKIKRILQFCGLALLVAAIPAIFVFANSLWIVLITADAEREEDALLILAEDAWFARNRQYHVASLRQDDDPLQRTMPVINLADPGPPPKPAIAARFPSCDGPEVIEDTEKLRRYRATGYPYFLRLRQVDDARSIIFARKLGVMQLALVKSCLVATPFSNSCGDWLEGQSSGDDAVVALLKEKQQLVSWGDKLCWPQRELAAPAVFEEE